MHQEFVCGPSILPYEPFTRNFISNNCIILNIARKLAYLHNFKMNTIISITESTFFSLRSVGGAESTADNFAESNSSEFKQNLKRGFLKSLTNRKMRKGEKTKSATCVYKTESFITLVIHDWDLVGTNYTAECSQDDFWGSNEVISTYLV